MNAPDPGNSSDLGNSEDLWFGGLSAVVCLGLVGESDEYEVGEGSGDPQTTDQAVVPIVPIWADWFGVGMRGLASDGNPSGWFAVLVVLRFGLGGWLGRTPGVRSLGCSSSGVFVFWGGVADGFVESAGVSVVVSDLEFGTQGRGGAGQLEYRSESSFERYWELARDSLEMGLWLGGFAE